MLIVDVCLFMNRSENCGPFISADIHNSDFYKSRTTCTGKIKQNELQVYIELFGVYSMQSPHDYTVSRGSIKMLFFHE